MNLNERLLYSYAWLVGLSATFVAGYCLGTLAGMGLSAVVLP